MNRFSLLLEAARIQPAVLVIVIPSIRNEEDEQPHGADDGEEEHRWQGIVSRASHFATRSKRAAPITHAAPRDALFGTGGGISSGTDINNSP